MAAHVHEDAAAGVLHVPEPVRVRAVVALQLPRVVDLAQGALVRELLGADVFGGEAEVLPVHQDHALVPAGLDHAVAVGEAEGQRLVHQHVLAGGGRRQGDAGVEVVGAGDGDGVDEVVLQHVFVVDEGVGDAEGSGEHPDVFGVRGSGRDDLHVRRLQQRLGVQAGHEPRADDPDANCHLVNR